MNKFLKYRKYYINLDHVSKIYITLGHKLDIRGKDIDIRIENDDPRFTDILFDEIEHKINSNSVNVINIDNLIVSIKDKLKDDGQYC